MKKKRGHPQLFQKTSQDKFDGSEITGTPTTISQSSRHNQYDKIIYA
ncbi:hypothetical protein [Aliikangiella sp. IMCC44632]